MISKKMLSILLAILMITAVIPITVSGAMENAENYYTYTVENGEATITKASDKLSSDIVIPSTLGGYPVTGIEQYAFYSNSNIRKVTIPYGVTYIGEQAFAICDITEIVIPDSVTSIDTYAFYWCDKLTKVNLPASITYLGDAFYRCEKLTEMNVAAENKNFCSVDGVLYSKDMTKLYYYPEGKADKEYTIPKQVSSIKYLAGFEYCKNLEAISVEEGNQHFASIDGILFSKDYKTLVLCPPAKIIEKYSIPDTVEKIAFKAFEGCSISEIYMSDSVKLIEGYAFANSYELKKITISENAYISYGLFSGCIKLESVNIPEKTTHLGSRLFYHCSSLTDVTIPENVTSIGSSAFEHCYNLKNINIPDSVTEIGNWAFLYCTALETIDLSENVSSIGTAAFSGCDSLKKINVSSNNKYYCNTSNALYTKDMTELMAYFNGLGHTSFTIPEGVTTIQSEVFSSSKLKKVGIPSSVQTDTRELQFSNSIENIYYQGDAEGWKNLNTSTGFYAHIHYNCYPVKAFTETVTPATHYSREKITYSCECGVTYDRYQGSIIPHEYSLINTVEPGCYNEGYLEYYCECGSYIYEYIEAAGHINEDGDKICDVCNEILGHCSCMCHNSSGITGFLWKLLNFFYKIFGTNRICECGMAHY